MNDITQNDQLSKNSTYSILTCFLLVVGIYSYGAIRITIPIKESSINVGTVTIKDGDPKHLDLSKPKLAKYRTIIPSNETSSSFLPVNQSPGFRTSI
ncbi:hypothetical protein [Leptospira brenneri]|uniref:Uncharacterized protein n=1 Tax=Leptospira brenneri TaxID=2023182 RepID=A0A2M9Y0A9_9LEPT|nr:hypothetical protein [Leptospira brenneri]PJZ45000.1 hypothetical protein CH361_12175 [Leptospira brenneri]TGK95226.1 hypothetical protein EHQ30_00865 [Leptospira brenneri]